MSKKTEKFDTVWNICYEVCEPIVIENETQGIAIANHITYLRELVEIQRKELDLYHTMLDEMFGVSYEDFQEWTKTKNGHNSAFGETYERMRNA